MTEIGATFVSGAGIVVAGAVGWLIHQIIGINSRMAALEQLTKDIRDQLIRMNEVSDSRDARNEKRLIT
jgi:hypothetical protein